MKAPKYPTSHGTEKELLEKHLDFTRETLIYKVEGLTDDLARKKLGRTPTSVAGIVKHLTDVERWWFKRGFFGEEWTSPHCSEENPDGDFDILPHETVEVLLEEYKKACQESRIIYKDSEVDETCKRKRFDGTFPTLRWVFLHMIEETARHNGQLDIYRELLDGTTDWKG